MAHCGYNRGACKQDRADGRLYCPEHREQSRIKTQMARDRLKNGPADPTITTIGINYNGTTLPVPPTFTDQVSINGTLVTLEFPPNLSTTTPETSGSRSMNEIGRENRRIILELLKRCKPSWVVRLNKKNTSYKDVLFGKDHRPLLIRNGHPKAQGATMKSLWNDIGFQAGVTTLNEVQNPDSNSTDAHLNVTLSDFLEEIDPHRQSKLFSCLLSTKVVDNDGTRLNIRTYYTKLCGETEYTAGTYCNKGEIQKIFPSWVTVSTAGCFEDFHQDAGGCCTQISIAHGRKLWFFEDEDTKEVCVEILLQGDVLIIPPNTTHAVYSPCPVLAVGHHFFHYGTMALTKSVRAKEAKTTRYTNEFVRNSLNALYHMANEWPENREKYIGPNRLFASIKEPNLLYQLDCLSDMITYYRDYQPKESLAQMAKCVKLEEGSKCVKLEDVDRNIILRRQAISVMDLRRQGNYEWSKNRGENGH